jgi:hypothetical protein
MFGTIATKSRGVSIPAALIVSAVKAVTVTGTLCRVSSRLRAVTTISVSSLVWAGAGVAMIAAIIAVAAASHLYLEVLI